MISICAPKRLYRSENYFSNSCYFVGRDRFLKMCSQLRSFLCYFYLFSSNPICSYFILSPMDYYVSYSFRKIFSISKNGLSTIAFLILLDLLCESLYHRLTTRKTFTLHYAFLFLLFLVLVHKKLTYVI